MRFVLKQAQILGCVEQVCAVGMAGLQGMPAARVDPDGAPQVHLHLPHLPGTPSFPCTVLMILCGVFLSTDLNPPSALVPSIWLLHDPLSL